MQHQSFIGFLHVFGQEGNIYQFHPFNDGTSEFPGDVLYYLATSALRGMAPEKRRQMFGSYPFMLGWLKELGRLAERITGVLDRLRTDNRLPDGTRNDKDEEEEP